MKLFWNELTYINLNEFHNDVTWGTSLNKHLLFSEFTIVTKLSAVLRAWKLVMETSVQNWLEPLDVQSQLFLLTALQPIWLVDFPMRESVYLNYIDSFYR